MDCHSPKGLCNDDKNGRQKRQILVESMQIQKEVKREDLDSMEIRIYKGIK
ncbi:hypothetical protein [Helicobacter fennelliae]|uniref:Uncharacterized protein n=1 Tax=Helicobacter fennelliae MRY12-0050 TaxID=1325130 RepID=T1DV57_9HELI|nr:hypothetical protein [Helicobacter fennelliae]GAD18438.1 hypothetical protein HFN_2366 [Helicobacter fennelliae MRY12-0050]